MVEQDEFRHLAPPDKQRFLDVLLHTPGLVVLGGQLGDITIESISVEDEKKRSDCRATVYEI